MPKSQRGLDSRWLFRYDLKAVLDLLNGTE